MANAADQSDVYFHVYGAWYEKHDSIGTSFSGGYLFWDDFSLGFVFDQNSKFIAPGLEFRWFTEPFEFALSSGPLYWVVKGEEETLFQFAFNANYLIAITPSIAGMVMIKGHFIDDKFRTASLGLGARILF